MIKKIIAMLPILISLSMPCQVFAEMDRPAAGIMVTEEEEYKISVAYVSAKHAPLFAEAKENSSTLKVLDLNERVDVSVNESEGDYATVITKDGIRGYILKSQLSEEKTKTYSDEDLYILAHVICGEMQGMPDQDQLYTGSVVLNRVKGAAWPNSIHDVVFQKGQYTCTRDGNYNRQPTERNWANARYLLENGSILPENVVYQASGKQGKGVYAHTKHAYYCYS